MEWKKGMEVMKEMEWKKQIKIKGNMKREGAEHLFFFMFLFFSLFIFSFSSVYASPQGWSAAAGQAVINQSGGTTTIQQLTNNVIINWNSFNIGAGQLVQFLQPSALSAALNRVVGADPSVILGELKSNGMVFLINPNGILFGQGAQIDTGSFIASTLNMTNEDFLSGDYTFNQISTVPASFIVNEGTIQANQGGSVVLLAPLVDNEGTIIANLGDIGLGAGQLVQFLQPGALSAALNRVVGADPSVILGELKSNGMFFLINPNGILFGQGAQIDTGSFIASTLNMTNEDFLSGDYTFNQISTVPASFIVNEGTIQASQGGSVVLLAPLVDNEGTIIANLGEIGLGAAAHAVLSYDKEGLMNLVLSNPSGVPQDVAITQQAYTAILQQVVNNKGMLPATSVEEVNGKIVLTNAGGTLVNAGVVEANGAAGVNAGSISLDSTQDTDLLTESLISANGEGVNSQ